MRKKTKKLMFGGFVLISIVATAIIYIEQKRDVFIKVVKKEPVKEVFIKIKRDESYICFYQIDETTMPINCEDGQQWLGKE